MDHEQQEKTGPESLLAAWIESANDFWRAAAKYWPEAAGASKPGASFQPGAESRARESWQSGLKMFQALISALSEPGAMDAFSRGINSLPDIVLGMAKTGWDGYFQLQQQWMERVGKMGQRSEAYQFENLDQGVFKAWRETYEKNFRQFLNIPQLGLTRLYQERMNRVADEFNLYQEAVSEFMHMLYLPVEKSLQVVMVKLEEVSKQGELSDNLKDYYNMWIKILEGHYMTLFKSPEYTRVLSKLLTATEDFKMAKQEVLGDFLSTLPIPTNKDMDELCKEIYLLKKKVKELEKKLNSSESLA
jgi:class III poly(R)-hydroxyalkanoic acid synthase PhaE subunit